MREVTPALPSGSSGSRGRKGWSPDAWLTTQSQRERTSSCKHPSAHKKNPPPRINLEFSLHSCRGPAKASPGREKMGQKHYPVCAFQIDTFHALPLSSSKEPRGRSFSLYLLDEETVAHGLTRLSQPVTTGARLCTEVFPAPNLRALSPHISALQAHPCP